MRFELFIARRYLRAKRRQAFIGIITGISCRPSGRCVAVDDAGSVLIRR